MAGSDGCWLRTPVSDIYINIISATFKNRLDEVCIDQGMLYGYEAYLTGIGIGVDPQKKVEVRGVGTLLLLPLHPFPSPPLKRRPLKFS